MTEVVQFHNLSHIFISLIGSVLLAAIYYNIRDRYQSILEEESNQKRVDRGLLYLSLAMFMWVVSGLWNFCGVHFAFSEKFIFLVGENFWSIVNNMFLLLALYYFHNAPSFIYKNEKSIKTILILIISITAITLLLSSWLGNFVFNSILITAVPDLLLSGFLCYLLSVSLFKTFQERGLRIVSYLSVIVIVLMLASQLPSVFLSLDDGFANNIIKIIAKTSLISLFLVLATTWAIQLANTPVAKDMKLQFVDWSLIKLTIPSKNILAESIDFGSKTTQYRNLFKLAFRRKYGKGDDQSMIIGTRGEIKNQTYITRIIDNINEALNLDAEHKLERKDLFTFLGDGRYRLRLMEHNILFGKALQNEFLAQSENKIYQELMSE